MRAVGSSHQLRSSGYASRLEEIWYGLMNATSEPLGRSLPEARGTGGGWVFSGPLSRAFLALWILFQWSALLASLIEPALGASTEDCILCHRDRASAHIQDWEQSIHARSRIGCTNCHVGTRDNVNAARVGSDKQPAACLAQHQGVVAMCAGCHQDVGQAFRESLHYRNAGNGPATPTCVDCHSAAGGSILSGDSIPRRCATCHSASGAAGNAWVTEKAPDLLQLLRRVTLARTMVAEHLDQLGTLGGDVAVFRAELGRVDASFKDIPIEWHRFNLEDAESRSRHALDILESLHERVERRLAQSEPEPPPAALFKVVSPAPPMKGRPLRFAVASMADPIATYEAYLDLFNDLAAALGRPYQFVQRRTYQELNELLLQGQVDLAFICSGAYAALPENAPIEIIALPVVNGKSVYHSLIIVRKNSPAQRFEDLKGARFAFTDLLSNTGYLYPAFRLTNLGTDSQRFFAGTLLSGSHDESILAVYRKLVDAAAVDDLVFYKLVSPESPYRDQLRVIESSPDFAIPPVVAPITVPAGLRARMRRFLLGLAQTPQGRARLAALGFDGFTAGGKEDYASIRKMLEVTGAKPR